MSVAPAPSRILPIATPAAPTPEMTIDRSSIRLPVIAQRVLERRQRDDRRAVLVVVEDGDVEQLLERLLDLERTRCGDVFEVDPAEGRARAG